MAHFRAALLSFSRDTDEALARFRLPELFGLDARLTPANADEYYDSISEKLKTLAFRPRALFERFQLEVLATTDSPLDSLAHHETIRASALKGQIIPTFRPDAVVDPDFHGFKENLARLAQMTGVDTSNWEGYVSALRQRRLEFKALGCTATDHGHATAATADLSSDAAARLFHKVASGSGDPDERELFRAQMLTEMAAMSTDDGWSCKFTPEACATTMRGYSSASDEISARTSPRPPTTCTRCDPC